MTNVCTSSVGLPCTSDTFEALSVIVPVILIVAVAVVVVALVVRHRNK